MGLSCVEFSPFLQLVSSHSSDGNERTWGDNESWLGATMNRLGATVMLAWGDNESWLGATMNGLGATMNGLGATMNRLGATVMLAWGDNERTGGDNDAGLGRQ